VYILRETYTKAAVMSRIRGEDRGQGAEDSVSEDRGQGADGDVMNQIDQINQ